MQRAFNDLDDSTVILALQEFSEDFRDVAGEPVVDDFDTAAEIVGTVLSHAGFEATGWMPASQTEAVAAGRRLLERLAADPATAATVAVVLDEPPTDDRLAVESLVASGAVLGAVLTWLQTKVEITVRRRGGKTEIEFMAQKEQASDSLLKDLADMLWSTLRGRGGPTSS